MLDGIVAAVPPGQKLARVGDMEILVTNLKAWRAQLAGGPAPKIAFAGGVPAWTGGGEAGPPAGVVAATAGTTGGSAANPRSTSCVVRVSRPLRS